MTEPVVIGNATLYRGDCLDVLRTLPDAGVDAVVTDPPYALAFMGRHWDKGFPDQAIWAECLRILRPGGHLMSFGAPRTHHRLWSMIEDAGFQIIDTVSWVFGSGFPKHKTLLKPAYEPICLAAKPGKRWLNIDGCRVPLTGDETPDDFRRIDPPGARRMVNCFAQDKWTQENFTRNTDRGHESGRWPTNFIHDGSPEVVALFPETKSPGAFPKEVNRKDRGGEFCQRFSNDSREQRITLNETGSSARFFYCAKASKADRDEGLEHLPERLAPCHNIDGRNPENPKNYIGQTPMPFKRNTHPTVKPTALMRYLCRLITPPGGIVLDPFMGSGSTGKAAIREGFRFIGIEREPEYFDIARARIEDAQRQATLNLEPAA